MPDASRPKPLPVVTDESRPFWDGCRQGKLLLQYCGQCQRYQFYPRLYCMQCGAETPGWVESSGRGIIYSYTIIRQSKAPEFMHDTPYNIAIVQLEEGPRLMSNIVDVEPTNLRVDLPVQVVFDAVTENISIPRFRPA
ncbi:MAG TPA: Zn-ribbon domain-containing OB-fold protein [Ktedonobacteraceae bacterium]|nr:Zn-ribbon domain-containing OB-fold protein [Ktedonobacteraceae bacterium]